MMKKLKLLSSSFIMALTLAAPLATYAMEPEEDRQAVTKKAPPASRRFLYTYLGVALESDVPILEAIYHSAPLRHLEQRERFLQGKLVYKPDPNSEEGMVVLPIADLANPLEGEFDLSKCGDYAASYLSVNIGYRKGKRPENASKVEIWIAPHFVIKDNLEGSASHFKNIMAGWNAEAAPVGLFWTWGGWDNMGWHDYLTSQNVDQLANGENLYDKWNNSSSTLISFPERQLCITPGSIIRSQEFYLLF